MLIAALIFNLVVLLPVLVALATAHPGMEAAFGPDTDARRILTCLYAAIAMMSAVLIALHVAQHVWAVPMTVALFAVQITYKLATVAVVGLSSPVVLTNLAVVAVHLTALAVLVLRP